MRSAGPESSCVTWPWTQEMSGPIQRSVLLQPVAGLSLLERCESRLPPGRTGRAGNWPHAANKDFSLETPSGPGAFYFFNARVWDQSPIFFLSACVSCRTSRVIVPLLTLFSYLDLTEVSIMKMRPHSTSLTCTILVTEAHPHLREVAEPVPNCFKLPCVP